jgi:hypothetical protein
MFSAFAMLAGFRKKEGAWWPNWPTTAGRQQSDDRRIEMCVLAIFVCASAKPVAHQ